MISNIFVPLYYDNFLAQIIGFNLYTDPLWFILLTSVSIYRLKKQGLERLDT